MALLAVGLAGCQTTQLTPAQDAALVGVAATTGAAIAGVVKPAIAVPAGTVAGAIAGGAGAAATILTPAPQANVTTGVAK